MGRQVVAGEYWLNNKTGKMYLVLGQGVDANNKPRWFPDDATVAYCDHKSEDTLVYFRAEAEFLEKFHRA